MLTELAHAIGKCCVHAHPGQVAIVQPGAAQAPILEHEPQRLNQMQGRADVGTQAYDVAGIGRYLGLIENDVQHVARTSVIPA